MYAGIILGTCGLLSTLLGLYMLATAWILEQALIDKWQYLGWRWMPTILIDKVMRRQAKKLALRWIKKSKFEITDLEPYIRRRINIAVFWIALGAALFALAGLVVGLTAIMNRG